MKKVNIGGVEYELIENVKDCFDLEQIIEKYTEYFDGYDYILGDYAYGKLRLKGFYEHNNAKKSPINDINIMKDYLNNQCAYGCKYYLLKKIK